MTVITLITIISYNAQGHLLFQFSGTPTTDLGKGIRIPWKLASSWISFDIRPFVQSYVSKDTWLVQVSSVLVAERVWCPSGIHGGPGD